MRLRRTRNQSEDNGEEEQIWMTFTTKDGDTENLLVPSLRNAIPPDACDLNDVSTCSQAEQTQTDRRQSSCDVSVKSAVSPRKRVRLRIPSESPEVDLIEETPPEQISNATERDRISPTPPTRPPRSSNHGSAQQPHNSQSTSTQFSDEDIQLLEAVFAATHQHHRDRSVSTQTYAVYADSGMSTFHEQIISRLDVSQLVNLNALISMTIAAEQGPAEYE